MAHEISGGLPAAEAKNARAAAPLLRDFVRERYLPFVRQNKRSWKVDQSNLGRHILPYLGSYQLPDITAGMLLAWVDALEQAGLSYGTCFRQFWLAKYVLNCAVRWGALASDAAFKAARLPAKPGRSPVLLETSDLVRLLDILKKYPDRAAANAIQLMLLTGASKSEILAARWEDVDFARGVLATTANFTGRQRLIALNSAALKLVRKLPRRDGVPWLFAAASGMRLTYITRDWQQIRGELGRPELRLQDLRHSFANFLVSMGVNRQGLHTLLGHYRPETLALVREGWQRAHAPEKAASP